MTGTRATAPRLAGDAGMVGKAAAIWLLIAAVLVVAMLDAVSIGRTTLHASEIAAEAASDGAAAFRTQGRNAEEACEAVGGSIEARDPALKLGRHGCGVDETTGRVTVTIKTMADTIVLGRLAPTESYATVVVSEANGGSNV